MVEKKEKETERTSPLFVVVLTFPSDVNSRVKEIQEKYGLSVSRKIRPIGAHLTIKSPFYSVEAASIIEGRLQQVADKTGEFPLELDGISSFEGGLVYVSVSDQTTLSLRSLHSEVATNLASVVYFQDGSRFELDQYVPHVTISSRLSGREPQEELFNEKINLKVNVGAFSLYYTPRPDGLWIPKKTFPFGLKK